MCAAVRSLAYASPRVNLACATAAAPWRARSCMEMLDFDWFYKGLSTAAGSRYLLVSVRDSANLCAGA